MRGKKHLGAVIPSIFALVCTATITAGMVLGAGAATVGVAPTITTQPVSETVASGSTVSFAAAATGTPSPVLQWQVSTNGGTSFSNLPGVTGSPLTFTAIPAVNGYEFRVVATNPSGSATSNAATLTVGVAPTITTQPVSETVASGSTVSFSAAASGIPAPILQWQVSINGGTSFSNLPGVTGSPLTFTAIPAVNGYEFRVVATNSSGSATSSAATLTVGTAPTITTEPVSETVVSGSTVSFSAAATGTPSPVLQWQVSTNGGTSFSNLPGVTGSPLTFTAIPAVNGYEFRVVATNSSGSATTSTATLNVAPTGDVVPSSAGGYFAASSCGTSQRCVAVGGTQASGALIEVSSDGGSTFTTAAVPAVTGPMSAVDCNDALHCVAVGGPDIMTSTDGGAVWTSMAIPNPDPATSSLTLAAVACQSDTQSAAVGNEIVSSVFALSSPEYIYSTDGGQTWADGTSSPGQNQSGAVTCTTSACVSVGEALDRSTDGGATWQELAINGGEQGFLSVSCTAGGASCLAIGPNAAGISNPAVPGQLGVSNDGGQTWTNESTNLPPTTGTLQTISCGGAAACMTVGPPPSGDGPLFVSTTGNSGTSWTSENGPSGFSNPPVRAGYPSVTCTSATSCLVVGAGASGPLVALTSNEGATWTSGKVG